MNVIYAFAAGLIIGLIGGALIWRKNGQKIEAGVDAVTDAAKDVKSKL